MTEFRVLIDLSVLENRPFTGVERYAFEIARRLPGELGEARVFAASAAARLDPAELPGLELIRGRRLPRALWRRIVLPRMARRLGAALLFAPVSSVPLSRRFVSVRTIHDLGRPPRLPRPREVATVMPSAATRRDLEALLPDLRAPCVVIPHGVDDAFLANPRTPRPGPRVLVVGRVRERRRPEVVAAAAATLAARIPGFEIRWAGPGGEDRPAGPGLRFLGYLEREDLLAEMAAASFLLAPADLEGFGLPVVEAMAAGLPVLAREQPALAEVGGDMVSTYDHDDPQALADRIAAFLGSNAHPAEADLRAWAHRFDWDLAARRHADFFRSLLAR